MKTERLLKYAILALLFAGGVVALYALAPFLLFFIGLVGVFALFALGVSIGARYLRRRQE